MNELRPDQQDAVERICAGLRHVSPGGEVRGQNIAACGTGKTLVQLRVREQLDAHLTLVLVPTLHLLAQLQGEWLRNRVRSYQDLTVCGDEQVLDGIVERASDYGLRPTTDPRQIADFLAQGVQERVIFCTYQSSPRIAEAQALAGTPAFDLVLCDEAHRTAGVYDSPFTTVLDNEKIRAKRRLFSTATPRIATRIMKSRDAASMDDASVFGPELYKLCFAEAIERGLLLDYDVVVLVADEESLAELFLLGGMHVDNGSATEQTKLMMVARAMEEYELRRILGFVNRVAKAKEFHEEFPRLTEILGWPQRPWAQHVAGTTSAKRRRACLDAFEKTDERAVLFNARCLAEGADLPSLDGIAFLDPRRSTIDITQAIGRALRIPPRDFVLPRRSAKILLPIFLTPGETLEQALESSDYSHLVDVFRILREMDENFLSDANSPAPRVRTRVFAKKYAQEDPSFRNYRVMVDGFLLGFVDAAQGGHPLTVGDHLKFDGTTLILEDGREFPNVPQLRGVIAEGWLQEEPVPSQQTQQRPESKIHLLNFSREDTIRLWRRIVVKTAALTYSVRKLTPDEVVRAVLKYAEKHGGRIPTGTSGDASEEFGFCETWAKVDKAGRNGGRGLPKGFTLRVAATEANLIQHKPLLTKERVLSAVAAYFADHGKHPNLNSGDAANYFGFPTTWAAVTNAGLSGARGLPKGFSLLQAAYELGIATEKPKLSPEMVRNAVQKYFEEHGVRPTQRSGEASKWFGFEETWLCVEQAGRQGCRGLPKGLTLAQVAQELGLISEEPGLSPSIVLDAVRRFAEEHGGETPFHTSGDASSYFGYPETWRRVNDAGRLGARGLPKKFTLREAARTLNLCHNAPVIVSSTDAAKKESCNDHVSVNSAGEWSLADIVTAVKKYALEHDGCAPTSRSGDATSYLGRSATWLTLDQELRSGDRGLPGGLSLAKIARAEGFLPQVLRTVQEPEQSKEQLPTRSLSREVTLGRRPDSEEDDRVLLVLRSAPEGGYSRRELELGTRFTPKQVSATLGRLEAAARISRSKGKFHLVEESVTAASERAAEISAKLAVCRETVAATRIDEECRKLELGATLIDLDETELRVVARNLKSYHHKDLAVFASAARVVETLTLAAVQMPNEWSVEFLHELSPLTEKEQVQLAAAAAEKSWSLVQVKKRVQKILKRDRFDPAHPLEEDSQSS